MNLLLITGAIDIERIDIPSTKLNDKQERLTQYIEALSYAIDHYTLVSHIVFCENTGFAFDYSALQMRARQKGKILEILTFKGDYKAIQQKGKGFGEGEIIQYVLNNSEVIRLFDSFYKLTGRLIVKNFDKIIQQTKGEEAFILNPKEIGNRSKSHIETFFYKTGIEFYKSNLLGAYQEVDEQKLIYLEHVFHDQITGQQVGCFPIAPMISGISGTTGVKYDPNRRKAAIEKFYYSTGIYKVNKNRSEKLFFILTVLFLKFYRAIR